MDSNRLKKPQAVKVQYKERAKNGGSYSSAAKASGLSGGTKKTSMKSGGKMGKCRGGC